MARLALLLLVLSTIAVAQTTPLDDFSSGSDAAWTRFDNLALFGQPTPTYAVASGEYTIGTPALPPYPVQLLAGSAWTGSLVGSAYANGYLRARVRVGTTATNALLVMRGSIGTFSGYFAALNNPQNGFILGRSDNGAQTAAVALPGSIVENTDYVVELGCVGTTITMRWWTVGATPPAAPQLSMNDSVYSTGGLAIAAYNQPSNWVPAGVGGVLSATFDDVEFRCPTLSVALTQSGGPGAPVQLTNTGLVPGSEYFNLISLDPCSAAVGAGPILGLCFSDLGWLVQQLLLPLGSAPFHYAAASSSATFGPFTLPQGLVIDAVCFEVRPPFAVGCISPVARFTVQ